MKKENELALVVAYYLSKYDRDGLKKLGYLTFNDAYRDIESKMGVKATSIKNRRDEFDPIHNNERVGWYQRPMSRSRVRIVEQFASMPEPTLRGIVSDIINQQGEVLVVMHKVLKEVFEKAPGKQKKFILRGPTGKKAEELFARHFKSGESFLIGTLNDCRDLGCGYDFLIENGDGVYYVEVKGLDGCSGGVVFTDKEWRTACEKSERYYLVVVSGVSGSPKIAYFKDPAAKFNPVRNIYTTINVSWSVSQKQVGEI
ncbi:MAG TPA: DUF3883 domain-containing protein [Candidatus Omnitrophota bacterium]|nr:DUF3883 domain-containing protein [Candidatus Omnitrophota bacterium]